MRNWTVALLLLILASCSSGGARHGVPAATTVPPSTGAPSPSTAASTPTSTSATTSTSTTKAAAAGPCTGAAPPAAYQHVVVIVMENRGLYQVNGSVSAPFVTRLGRECGLATGYSGVAHPSLPNYIAMTSGSTHGISDDAGPSAHPLPGQSIFSLLGTGWRSLQESMPVPCDHTSGGRYATKHNPAVYYTLLAATCPAQDVLMDAGAPDVSARYTFITPDLCNDGHDCPTATADHWLSVEVPLILDSAEYRSGKTTLFITWDENDAGNLVATYVIAPSVPPGTTVSTPLNHYSLLRTSEELLGLTPLLGQAATAPSMRSAFHL